MKLFVGAAALLAATMWNGVAEAQTWEALGGTYGGNPGVASWRDSAGLGHFGVYVAGGGTLYYREGTGPLTGTSTTWWPAGTGWQPITGQIVPPATNASPVAVSNGLTTSSGVSVFIRGNDNAIYSVFDDASSNNPATGSWSPYQGLGGVTSFDPAAVVVPSTHEVYVFVQGTIGGGLWYKHGNPATGTWFPSTTGWTLLGGSNVDDHPNAVVAHDAASGHDLVYVTIHQSTNTALYTIIDATTQTITTLQSVPAGGNVLGTPALIDDQTPTIGHYVHFISVIGTLGNPSNPLTDVYRDVSGGGFSALSTGGAAGTNVRHVTTATIAGNVGNRQDVVLVHGNTDELWMGSFEYGGAGYGGYSWVARQPAGSFVGEPQMGAAPNAARLDVYGTDSGSHGLHMACANGSC